jgi:hypothetical protein
MKQNYIEIEDKPQSTIGIYTFHILTNFSCLNLKMNNDLTIDKIF